MKGMRKRTLLREIFCNVMAFELQIHDPSDLGFKAYH